MLKFNSETVKLPCEAVWPDDIATLHLAEFVTNMMALVVKLKGYGLAANQVGLTKQIIVINCDNFREAIINPKIKRAWGGTAMAAETCLSLPGQSVRLPRFKRVTVTGQDIVFNDVEIKAKGILARVLQHEIDHMLGVTIFDRKLLGLFGTPTEKEQMK